ncbi:single-stranded DNA-binding protein [Candidatus Saccharibacteria bacterium]|jgi:single-strand DNA-binding protein|nr:single-stranded DNA-binding protein [Candidatus Saccharibacteria bacterium]MBQ3465084.1 single-stranded DNA-binding protein [Candidatus Saccharibacteria bacterium]MBR3253204.1 single-stranded DNA-binding protein [Candidatus Saccharibacteria bacterium]
MRGFSKAIITGNLTRDPELRTTPNGASVCSFSVAVNRVYRDSNGEQKEDVSFIDCSAWGKLGEMISQYAKKGSGVLVSGRLDQRSWEDKTSGQKRSRVEIVVEDFNFTGQAPTGGSSSTSEPTPSSDIPDDIPDEEIDLSDVPF